MEWRQNKTGDLANFYPGAAPVGSSASSLLFNATLSCRLGLSLAFNLLTCVNLKELAIVVMSKVHCITSESEIKNGD